MRGTFASKWSDSEIRLLPLQRISSGGSRETASAADKHYLTVKELVIALEEAENLVSALTEELKTQKAEAEAEAEAAEARQLMVKPPRPPAASSLG